jgi:hypothetical protein
VPVRTLVGAFGGVASAADNRKLAKEIAGSARLAGQRGRRSGRCARAGRRGPPLGRRASPRKSRWPARSAPAAGYAATSGLILQN